MIWLASFPRSGNTFFRNILFEVYGLESSTFHDDPDYFLDENYQSFPVVKTHMLPSELKPMSADIPAAYIIRDGRDTMCSIAHHRSDIVAPGSDWLENLKAAIIAEKGSFFGGWSQNVNHWIDRADIVIRYEDLLTDPIGQAERLRGLIDLPQADPEKLPSFTDLKFGIPKYGSGRDRPISEDDKKALAEKNFRKGKAGSWIEEMPADLHDLFWSMHGETMESLGYNHDGSLTRPDDDLDYRVINKLGLEPTGKPDRKMRILMEADKVILPDNDGVKRYQLDLLKGLIKVVESPLSRWEVDLYIKNQIYPLLEYKEQILNPFKTSDLKSGSNGHRKPKRSLIERFEHAIVSLVPDNFAAWLHKKNIRIFHQTYIFLKKILLGSINLVIRAINFTLGRLNIIYSSLRQLFIVPRSEKEFRNYDLIHLPLKQHYFPFRKTKAPLLTTVHDLTHRYFPQYHTSINISNAEKGLRFINGSGSDVLAVSRSTLNDTIKELEIDKEKIHLVYEAADKQKFHFEVNRDDTARVKEKYGIPADTAYFLCLSTLEPRKNIANTIKAFTALVTEHPDYPLALVIAGKKGWLAQQSMLQDQIYNERIVYTGFIDDNDLSSIYSEALALCYLSFYEGFGLPALEAMCCGTPVLYGNNSSLPEVVGQGGLAVDPHNIGEIKQKMLLLLEDKTLLNELKMHALRQSLNFSWRKSLKGTLQVYEKVINFGNISIND